MSMSACPVEQKMGDGRRFALAAQIRRLSAGHSDVRVFVTHPSRNHVELRWSHQMSLLAVAVHEAAVTQMASVR